MLHARAQAQDVPRTGSDHALLSVNGHPWTIHKSGVAVHVPKDRPSVLRVCTLGDAASRCFGSLEEQSEALLTQHTPGCEVMTRDCTCFRWMYSRDLTNTPSRVKASVSQRTPSCAIVTYTPQVSSQQSLTSVNLVFELDHFRPVLPRGYLWHLQKMYEHKVRTTNATHKSLPFSTFYYANREEVCAAQENSVQSLPVVPPHTPPRTVRRGFWRSAQAHAVIYRATPLGTTPCSICCHLEHTQKQV